MTDPFLVPCLVQLRTEYNWLSPNRDKGADGWIGDAAHLSRTSDHNPAPDGAVLAVDIDSTGPWPTGVAFADTVNLIIDRERSGQENRLEYVIYDQHIYSRSYGWTKRTYDGPAHIDHAHFSARHDRTGQNDTRGWNLLSLLPEVDMAFDEAEELQIRKNTAQGFADAFSAMAATIGVLPTDANRWGRQVQAAVRAVVGGPVDQMALLTAIASLDTVDPLALAEALGPVIVAGLVPEIIAALPEGGASAEEVRIAVENVIGRTGLIVQP